MTPFSPIRLVGGSVPLLPTIFPPHQPYNWSLFSAQEHQRLLDHVSHHLWFHASDATAATGWYMLARAIVWNILQSYETETNDMTLEFCRLLIKQTENFLWELPDPFRGESAWTEEDCVQYAERIVNGLLQTVRPMYFVLKGKEGRQVSQ